MVQSHLFEVRFITSNVILLFVKILAFSIGVYNTSFSKFGCLPLLVDQRAIISENIYFKNPRSDYGILSKWDHGLLIGVIKIAPS